MIPIELVSRVGFAISGTSGAVIDIDQPSYPHYWRSSSALPLGIRYRKPRKSPADTRKDGPGFLYVASLIRTALSLSFSLSLLTRGRRSIVRLSPPHLPRRFRDSFPVPRFIPTPAS
jgi:hypothetical protein